MSTDVIFHGVRGSIASGLRSQDVADKLVKALTQATAEDVGDEAKARQFVEGLPESIRGTYGGNSTSVSVTCGDKRLVIDAGTGLRKYSEALMAEGVMFNEIPLTMIMTHLHWDHIQAFPFFVPFYIPGNRVKVISVARAFEPWLKKQQESPYCPARWEFMQAEIAFEVKKLREEFEEGPFKIKSMPLNHPDGNVGYRIETPDGIFVFLSDTEVIKSSREVMDEYASFCQGADLVAVDAQYDFVTNYERVTWGHSSIFSFMDILAEADVKKLLMTHYDPLTPDEAVESILEKAARYREKVLPGASFEVGGCVEGQVYCL